MPRSSSSLLRPRHSLPVVLRCCVGLPSGNGPTTIFIWLPSSCGAVRFAVAMLGDTPPRHQEREDEFTSCLRSDQRLGHPVRVQQLCGDPNAGSLLVHIRPPRPRDLPASTSLRVPYKKPNFLVMTNEVHHANDNAFASVSQLKI